MQCDFQLTGGNLTGSKHLLVLAYYLSVTIGHLYLHTHFCAGVPDVSVRLVVLQIVPFHQYLRLLTVAPIGSGMSGLQQ